jgi:predicted DNA-binding transcriptional regulator AlpA
MAFGFQILNRLYGYKARKKSLQRFAGNKRYKKEGRKTIAETRAEASQSTLENAFSDLVRRAVRGEIQEIVRVYASARSAVNIDEVAQQLSVSKDWVYRNGKKLTLSKKMMRFSEVGLETWLKERWSNDREPSKQFAANAELRTSDHSSSNQLARRKKRLRAVFSSLCPSLIGRGD